jgi:predicted MFS family arabinose efflux permease
MVFQLYRNAYTGLSRPVWLLAVAMLINRSGTMVLPYLSLYMTQRLHFSVGQAGVVLAVFGAGALLGTFLGGQLTDRIGFYWIQVGSLLFGGLMLLALQFVTRFEWLCVVVFLFTTIGDSFRPANNAALAHYSTPDTRTRAYSLNRLAINLGWAFGGGIGGVLAGIDYRLLFWADGLTCIGAALYLRYALPRPIRTQPTSATGSGGHPPAQVRSPWRDGLFLAFIACVVTYTTAFVQFFGMLPVYFKKELGLREAEIGLLNAFNGLFIVLVEMAFVYWLEQRVRRRLRISVVGVLLTAVAWLALLNPWPGMAWVAVILLTIGEILAMPFMLAFASNRATNQNRGQYMGLYSMGWALAQVGSPALASQLADRFGFDTLWLVMAGLCVASAVGLAWVKEQETERVKE